MILDENGRMQEGFPGNEWEARYLRKSTIQRPRFMSAADYVFYLRRHLVAERRRNDPNVGHPGDESLSVGIPRLSFLLRRLEEDIQSSYLSFLEEFVSDLHDGVGCLLNLLRTCHGRQTTMTVFPYATCSRGRQNVVNRATIDEFYCLLCLKASSKCAVAVNKMADHRTGLSTLASCIMSTHMKSRSVAVELLTIICKGPDIGHQRVLEAMTAVRIIFGESVRFKFLISMLNSNIISSSGFETVALTFINTLLDQCPRLAERVRIQCELEEAGLDIVTLEKQLRLKIAGNNDRVWREIEKWRDLQVDLHGALQKHNENVKLRKEVQILKNALKKLQDERKGILNIHKELRGQWNDMEQRIQALALKSRGIPSSSDDPDSGDPDSPTPDYGRPMSFLVERSPLAESHDSELEEIFIDIPTIRATSVLEVREPLLRSSPPAPPPVALIPKHSDSGISSVLDSDPDPDLGIDWHYPEIPGIRVEKRHNSVRVRFSESTYRREEVGEAKASSAAVKRAPGENKTKYADISGIQSMKKQISAENASNPKKMFPGLSATAKSKIKEKGKQGSARTIPGHTTYKSGAGGGRKSHKAWARHHGGASKGQNGSQNNLKSVQGGGSSLSGMIHREIAKAIKDRHALFEV